MRIMFLNAKRVEWSHGIEERRAREFYRHVPARETRDDRVSPSELLRLLQLQDREFWNEEQRKRYFEELKKRGLVKGVQRGAVYRLPRGQDKVAEKDLYSPMKQEIEEEWTKAPGRDFDRQHDFIRVVDTSQGGRRPDGFWKRPDLTLVAGREVPYLPGNFVDIVTFEVKKWIPLMGVYEAFSHQRIANYTYVVYWFPEIWGRPDAQAMAEIESEASRCGVGVILAQQEDDYGCWRELVRPRRVETEPHVLERFLKTHCRGVLDELLAWINRPPVKHPTIKQPPRHEDFEKLELSEADQEIAREIYEELKSGGRGWSHFRHALGRPIPDHTIKKVRDAMRDMEFIDRKQGGGLYLRHSDD